MTKIQVTIELDDDVVDENDDTGLTEEAHEDFMDAITAFGSLADGPKVVL